MAADTCSQPMSNRTRLTVSDLVEAHFDAARWRGAAQELAEYHRQKLAILSRLFGFNLRRECLALGATAGSEEADARAGDRHEVAEVAAAAIADAARLWSPFSVQLIGRAGPLTTTLRGRHERPLMRSISRLVAAYHDLVEAAFLLLDPSLRAKRFPRAELSRHRLPETAPDPDDFP